MGSATSGRVSQLTLAPEIGAKWVEYLSLGAPLTDVAQAMGVDVSSYYNWRRFGKAIAAEINEKLAEGVAENDPIITKLRENIYYIFLKQTTQAQADARLSAVKSLVNAWKGGSEEVTQRKDTKTTTRLKKVRTEYPDGRVVIEEVPYEHVETNASISIRKLAPDWRAAEAYLMRRVPQEWSEKRYVGASYEAPILDMIRTDEIDYPQLVEWAGAELAPELWAKAGREPVAVQLTGGHYE